MTTNPKDSALLPPYGGDLINLVCPDEETQHLTVYANSLPKLRLSERSLCDLELLAVGAFSPLDRFMGQADYRRVLADMRLSSGHLFPIPVTLPVEPDSNVRALQDVALCNARNEPLAILTVEEIYEWNLDEASDLVFGTRDLRHPLVAEMNNWGRLNLSGPLRVLRLPPHYDFNELRLTPEQTRLHLQLLGRNVVAFQTRNPLHRAHEEMTKRAIAEKDGVLLLHPVVGMTKPGDVDHYTRVRSYKLLAETHYDSDKILLALLPLAMRLAGPREALWHAVIRRNYGANFLIVGRDHASPGSDASGNAFYPPYAAQEMLSEFSEELGVGVVPFQELVYSPEQDQYLELSEIRSGQSTITISGTEVRRDYLEKGLELPAWFTRPEVSRVLLETYRPRHQQGFCIWLTGLSCAGKSTIAEILTTILLEHGRRVTLLDGDVVRTNLSAGLGFTKKDRDTNIRRIGFVAAEIVHHGGVAICAAVSPYRKTRNEVRSMFGAEQFIEVHVDVALDICEQRDIKGMYSAARRGELQNFTGIDDPYEPPRRPELRLENESVSAEVNARSIKDFLVERGFLQPGDRYLNL